MKRHAAKRSLQRPLNNQILDYRVVLEVRQEEMKSIIFFGNDKGDMVKVREKMEKMVRQYLVQEEVIISFPSQDCKLDTNCAVKMTRLWTSMTSKFQLELILATLHHRLTSLVCTIRCGGSVW